MIKVTLACCALALTLLVAPPAQADSTPKAGDCYAKADIDKDSLDIRSKIDCSEPHAVQVTYVGKLPGFLRNRSKVALGSTKGALYARYVRAGYGICSARNAISSIWPQKGRAVVAALGTSVSVVPSSNPPLGSGWVLPDQSAWDKGVRSLICVTHLPPKTKTWSGDLRPLETSEPLLDFRLCIDRDGEFQSCAEPHFSEELLYWQVTGFPKGKQPSDAQLAPYDAQCQAAAEVLIGAKRSDLRATSTFLGRGKNEYLGKDIAGLACSVERVDGADLPGGTVVGLGSGSLSSS